MFDYIVITWYTVFPRLLFEEYHLVRSELAYMPPFSHFIISIILLFNIWYSSTSSKRLEWVHQIWVHEQWEYIAAFILWQHLLRLSNQPFNPCTSQFPTLKYFLIYCDYEACDWPTWAITPARSSGKRTKDAGLSSENLATWTSRLCRDIWITQVNGRILFSKYSRWLEIESDQ